jgi:hypothetical protein
LLTNLSPETRERLNRLLWQGKPLPAFWTLAAIFSLIINVALILILLFLGRELFALKSLVQDQLIGGLHTNFQKMDAANIVTTIEVNDTIRVNDTITVNDTIPVVFDLALQQETQVRLTKNTRLDDATIYLNGAPVALDIVLPKGTPLNIALDLVVPVNQQIPITLQVPVDLQVPVSLKVPVKIPLNQTELHEPFSGLQAVVAPYNNLLSGLPNSWSETPFCGPLTSWVCTAILGTP